MNYFNCAILLKRNTPYRSYKIYKAVYSRDMRNYAKKIYGSNYEDALDKAYRHILENYDSKKGDLAHYTVSIIHNIDSNSGKKEFSYDEVTTLAMDSLAFKENNGDPLDELLQKQDYCSNGSIKSCVQYLLKLYITDFVFFKSKKLNSRVNDYSELYEKYSVSTIANSLKYISDKYNESIEELYSLKKQMRFKAYSEDRYMDSFDKDTEYMCEFNGVVVYKKLKEKVNRVVYEVNIKEVLSRFKEQFYSGLLNRTIGGIDCYVTMSGRLVVDYGELLDYVEAELIGSILSRVQQMGVMRYEKGKSILLTSSAPVTRTSVTMLVLDIPFTIEMSMRVSKSVKNG